MKIARNSEIEAAAKFCDAGSASGRAIAAIFRGRFPALIHHDKTCHEIFKYVHS